jgi:SAM-dependent methyltransferase
VTHPTSRPATRASDARGPRDRAAVIRENLRLARREAPVYARNHFEIFHPWEQRRIALIAAGCERFARVLDIGAGTGNVLAKFPATCVRVGIDLSREMLTEARRTSPDLLLAVATADRLPFADGAFDLVVTYSTLHHLPDSLAALREMQRVLAPGGMLVLDHEEYFRERGWRGWVYGAMLCALRVLASGWYWRRPTAQPWLPFRRVHWPLSVTLGEIDFALTEDNPVSLDEIEAHLRADGYAARRRHYLLCPLPMVSNWQALAARLCRTWRMGHFAVVARKPPAVPTTSLVRRYAGDNEPAW